MTLTDKVMMTANSIHHWQTDWESWVKKVTRVRGEVVGQDNQTVLEVLQPKKAKLVSYIDPDAGLSDDERDSVPMDLESDDEDKENGGDGATGDQELVQFQPPEKERSHCMEELWDGGIKLPPEPRGECSRELQGRVTEARVTLTLRHVAMGQV